MSYDRALELSGSAGSARPANRNWPELISASIGVSVEPLPSQLPPSRRGHQVQHRHGGHDADRRAAAKGVVERRMQHDCGLSPAKPRTAAAALVDAPPRIARWRSPRRASRRCRNRARSTFRCAHPGRGAGKFSTSAIRCRPRTRGLRHQPGIRSDGRAQQRDDQCLGASTIGPVAVNVSNSTVLAPRSSPLTERTRRPPTHPGDHQDDSALHQLCSCRNSRPQEAEHRQQAQPGAK